MQFFHAKVQFNIFGVFPLEFSTLLQVSIDYQDKLSCFAGYKQIKQFDTKTGKKLFSPM